MPLIVLRLIFLLVAAGGAVSLLQSNAAPKSPVWMPWAVFGGIMLIAAAIVVIDWLLPRKPLDIISSVYFGLIVGLFLTYVARLALGPTLPLSEFPRACVELIVGLLICYTCISFLMQTRNDFRFLIP
ncbi:MAG TPA: PIN/TRAM domain-containing protein, partial [Pirellulales bacterium]|nr:PIN/TRAM domain-containing protein [Pirellulales bacterium]